MFRPLYGRGRRGSATAMRRPYHLRFMAPMRVQFRGSKLSINRAAFSDPNWPQIRFALSRGFANSGLFSNDITQGGALADSRWPWATIGHPYRVLSQPQERGTLPNDLRALEGGQLATGSGEQCARFLLKIPRQTVKIRGSGNAQSVFLDGPLYVGSLVSGYPTNCIFWPKKLQINIVQKRQFLYNFSSEIWRLKASFFGIFYV